MELSRTSKDFFEERKARMEIEPSFQEPSFQEPSYQEPSFQEPSFQEPSLQEPSLQEPSLQEPSFQEPSSRGQRQNIRYTIVKQYLTAPFIVKAFFKHWRHRIVSFHKHGAHIQLKGDTFSFFRSLFSSTAAADWLIMNSSFFIARWLKEDSGRIQRR